MSANATMPNENQLRNLAAALGKSEEEIAALIRQKPELAAALARMKPEDAQRLAALLSDKQAAARLLATPQAQEIIRAIFGKKGS